MKKTICKMLGVWSVVFVCLLLVLSICIGCYSYRNPYYEVYNEKFIGMTKKELLCKLVTEKLRITSAENGEWYVGFDVLFGLYVGDGVWTMGLLPIDMSACDITNRVEEALLENNIPLRRSTWDCLPYEKLFPLLCENKEYLKFNFDENGIVTNQTTEEISIFLKP